MRSFVIALVAICVIAGSGQAVTVVNITSDVNSDQSWGPGGTVNGDVFWIKYSISVGATAKLTILPNAVLKFEMGTRLTVNGKLRALGTANQQIVITSIRDDNTIGGDTNGDGNQTQPAMGDWYGITFADSSPDFMSLLQYCDVRYSGNPYAQTGALFFQSSSDSVSNCVIRRSYYGVDCHGTASPVVAGTSIQASAATPIALDFASQPIFASLVFSSSDNGYDALGIRGGTLASSAELIQRGATVGANPISNVTYVLLSSLTINNGASLTVDPGVVIKPSSYASITVNGNLTMNGSPADTITVTSINDDNFGSPRDTNNNGSKTAPAPNDWGQIVFNQGSTGSLSYCRLKFGVGYYTYGMVEMTNDNIPINHTILSDAEIGTVFHGVSNPVVDNVSCANMLSVPILMSAAANPALTNITFRSNAITALGIIGEDVSTDSRLYRRNVAGYNNITYYVLGNLHMHSPAVLRVDPSVVVKFSQYSGAFTIDGGLIADGTPDSVIVFTSFRDDQWGNPADTNGDGSNTNPSAGDWVGIHYTATSNDAVDKMDNCRVSFAETGPYLNSYGYVYGNLWITSAGPTITNCTFTQGANGIVIDGNSTPVIQNCTISNCSYAPFAMSVLSNPTIGTNSYVSNGYNGIGLLGESLSQSAVLRCKQNVGTPPYAYIPYGTLDVGTGVTLTVMDSVVVKPRYGTFLQVDGLLHAVGAPGPGRIVFTSFADDSYGGDTNADGNKSSPQPADWGSMTFTATSDSNSVLRNCLIQFGGTSNSAGAVVATNARPRLKRCEFFSNRTAMTFAGNSSPVVDSVTVLNCTYLPIVASLVSSPRYGPDIVLSNNSYTCLGILGETVAQNVHTTVLNLGSIQNIAYAPSANLKIAFGATWTIDPSVVIKLGRECGYDPIGTDITIDGALVAVGGGQGNPGHSIFFTSSADDAHGGDTYGDGAATHPAPGDWGAVTFSNVSDDVNTQVTDCQFLYGGGCYSHSGSLVLDDAGPTLTACQFQNNQYGVSIEGASTPRLQNCTIAGSVYSPVEMSLSSNPTFSAVTFQSNGYDALSIIPETIAADLTWKVRAVSGRKNMPYLLENGTLSVGLGATLTLQPGLIIKGGSNSLLEIQRAMIAEGKARPESLIVFTSVHDDFFGGDTDVGFEQAPQAGDWRGVQIDGTAIDDQVRFKDCIFRYSGAYYNTGALRAINSSPSVDSCLVANNYIGVSAEGSSNPTIHDSSIYSNLTWGVANFGTGFCVDARNNWWGDASGPRDTLATGDLCGLTTNFGSGDRVTNNVNYTSFDTNGIMSALLGDVSLNGSVTALDASDILQYLVAMITLSSLQKQVADVDESGDITGGDASLVLQYVAGGITTLPGEELAHGTEEAGLWAALMERMSRAQGDFQVSVGAAVPQGDGVDLPIQVTGSAPLYALELRLGGEAAADFQGLTLPSASALSAQNAGNGLIRIAMASASEVPAGQVMVLHFTPAAGRAWVAPTLDWSRVNGAKTPDSPSGPSAPTASYLSHPYPNPARDQVSFNLGLARTDAGTMATVHVFDVAGRKVRSLLDGRSAAGVSGLTWDLRDAQGRRVPAGIYWVRAESGRFTAIERLVVAR